VLTPGRSGSTGLATTKRARPHEWDRGAVRFVLLVGLLLAEFAILPRDADLGVDALSYWLPDPVGRYALAAEGLEGAGAFRYAPPLALPVLAFGLLPLTAFVAGWTLLLLATLAWLVGWWAIPILALYPITREVGLGNIHLLIAAAVVLGFRYPVAWAFPVLAKVTPVVGLAWFTARREWRSLVLVASVSAGLLVTAELALPGATVAWIDSLYVSAGTDAVEQGFPVPLVMRLPLAALLAGWGGLTNRRWTVPVAILIALPHVGPSSLAILCAVPRLVGVLRLSEYPLAGVRPNRSAGP